MREASETGAAEIVRSQIRSRVLTIAENERLELSVITEQINSLDFSEGFGTVARLSRRNGDEFNIFLRHLAQ